MIRFVNDRLVPVWLNTRNHRWPEVPAIAGDEWELALIDGYVASPFYKFYFVRSYVISPDLRTLLNEEEGRVGHIETEADPYLAMLQRAVRVAY